MGKENPTKAYFHTRNRIFSVRNTNAFQSMFFLCSIHCLQSRKTSSNTHGKVSWNISAISSKGWYGIWSPQVCDSVRPMVRHFLAGILRVS